MAAPLWQFSGSETGNASQWFPQDAQPWLDDLLEREDMVPVLVHPLEVVPNAALKLVCDVGVAGVRAKQEHCGGFQRRNTYMHAIHCFLKTQNASLTSSFTKPSASRHINTEEDQWLLLEPGSSGEHGWRRSEGHCQFAPLASESSSSRTWSSHLLRCELGKARVQPLLFRRQCRLQTCPVGTTLLRRISPSSAPCTESRCQPEITAKRGTWNARESVATESGSTVQHWAINLNRSPAVAEWIGHDQGQ